MNDIHKVLLALFFGLTISFGWNTKCQAQDVESLIKSHRYSLSYYGNNGIRPGLSSRADLTLKSWDKTRVSRRFLVGPKINRQHQKQLMYFKNSAMYIHPKTHVSFVRTWGVGYRKTRTKGWEYQFDIAPLGVQFFFMGETYKVSDDGSVKKKNMSISAYYTPGISASFGKKFKNKSGSLEAWHVRTSINSIANYNNTWLPTANIEVGLRFRTGKLMKKVLEDEND